MSWNRQTEVGGALFPAGFLWVACATFHSASWFFPRSQLRSSAPSGAPWAGNNVRSPRLGVEVSSLAPSGWQPLPASFGTLLAKAVTFLSVGWVELLCKLPLLLIRQMNIHDSGNLYQPDFPEGGSFSSPSSLFLSPSLLPSSLES